MGLLSAGLVAFTGPAQDHTFAVISFYTQSAISLPLPFVSVLLMTEISGVGLSATTRFGNVTRCNHRREAAGQRDHCGDGSCLRCLDLVVATSAAVPAADEGRWDAMGMIILGSALVQLIAQLSGAGWGLLLRSSALAIGADAVVPLGLWIITGAIPALQGVQAWLAPFASVRNLLSGHMDAERWAHVGVIALVWVVALNAAGILRLHRLRESGGG